MNSLTPSERRTVRLAAIGIGLYLALFFGFKSFQGFGQVRTEYDRLVRSAHTLRQEVEPYRTRAEKLQRLIDRTQIDPGTLTTNTVVGLTSAALQSAATAGGLQLGPVRESLARTTEREVGSIQFDAMGPAAAVMGFVARLGTLGVPVVVDSVQITGDPRGPGMLKLHLSLIILDFDQWKTREVTRA
jgi:hypothetical protein